MKLSAQQAALLQSRRGAFDVFVAEGGPVLRGFAESLQLPEPERARHNVLACLGPMAKWLDAQVASEADSPMFDLIVMRAGYLVGEVLLHRFGGRWVLNDDPGARSFGCFVTGRFTKAAPTTVVDPMAVAVHYAAQPPRRDLRRLIAQIEGQISRAAASS